MGNVQSVGRAIKTNKRANFPICLFHFSTYLFGVGRSVNIKKNLANNLLLLYGECSVGRSVRQKKKTKKKMQIDVEVSPPSSV